MSKTTQVRLEKDQGCVQNILFCTNNHNKGFFLKKQATWQEAKLGKHEMSKLRLVTHVCITNLGENLFLLKYKCKKFF